ARPGTGETKGPLMPLRAEWNISKRNAALLDPCNAVACSVPRNGRRRQLERCSERERSHLGAEPGRRIEGMISELAANHPGYPHHAGRGRGGLKGLFLHSIDHNDIA